MSSVLLTSATAARCIPESSGRADGGPRLQSNPDHSFVSWSSSSPFVLTASDLGGYFLQVAMEARTTHARSVNARRWETGGSGCPGGRQRTSKNCGAGAEQRPLLAKQPVLLPPHRGCIRLPTMTRKDPSACQNETTTLQALNSHIPSLTANAGIVEDVAQEHKPLSLPALLLRDVDVVAGQRSVTSSCPVRLRWPHSPP